MMPKGVVRFFYICFAVGFGIILLCATPALAKSWVWFLAVPVAAGLLVLAWHFLKKLPAKVCHIAAGVLLVVWACGIFAFAVSIRVFPTWDFGSNHEAAVHLYEHGQFVSPVIRDYYLRHIHNLAPMLALTVWYILTLPLGIDSVISGILLNVLALSVSLLFLYLAVNRWKGAAFALFTLLVGALSAPYVLYAPIFYTDTFTFPL